MPPSPVTVDAAWVADLAGNAFLPRPGAPAAAAAGTLHAWRRDPDRGWVALVSFTHAGLGYQHWIPAAHLAPREVPDCR